jgi:hypothetical protein
VSLDSEWNSLSDDAETLTHLTMENIFFLEAFLATCSDPEFHDQWMASDIWAELICFHSNLLETNSFTGIQSNKVFHSRVNAYISTKMDIDQQNVPRNHFGILGD